MTTDGLDRIQQLVDAWAPIDAQLTGPGGPFEVVEEDVLGQRLTVFRDRHRSIRSVLESAAATHGDRTCVVFGDGRKATFASFADDVAATAAALAARGIGPGDRVAIFAANGPGWLHVLWGATSLGAVVVAMNGWWTATEARHALELTEPALLLGDAKRLARLDRVDLPVLDLDDDLPGLVAEHRGASLPTVHLDEDDPALLLFTSGTTGRPKAAVLSHRCVVGFVQLQSFIGARSMLAAGVRPGDGPPPARLAVFPLFHVSGLGTTVGGVLTGTSTVWPLGRFDPEHVIELTKQHGIASWGGTVTHIMRLLESPAIDTIDPATIVQVGIGGSATSPELVRRTEARFPHLKGTFASGYGSTETGGLVSYASNAMLVAEPSCVGPVLPTVEVRILDDDGIEVAEGEEGNVCVRSPIVMQEYWRHPAANAEAFLPGRWLRTGDYGRLAAGALHLASRRRDLIIRGGENVYPFEIENRLEEHPDIAESAVVGVEDATLGQSVRAYVVADPDAALSVEAVQAWCAEALAPFKVPASVVLRSEPLPRNASGKVLKHVLAEGAANDFVEE